MPRGYADEFIQEVLLNLSKLQFSGLLWLRKVIPQFSAPSETVLALTSPPPLDGSTKGRDHVLN